jgi:hypothetical protein
MCGVNSQEMRSILVSEIEGNGNVILSNDDHEGGYKITVEGKLTDNARSEVVDYIGEEYITEENRNDIITVTE